MEQITYDNFQKIRAPKPVNRLAFFEKYCTGKNILDLGSYDETAAELKSHTGYWLFSILEKKAKKVVGIDLGIPGEVFQFGSAQILKKDVYKLKGSDFPDIELVTAGEILEHLDSPIDFLRYMKKEFSGKELVLSTPNGLNFSNTLMGMIKREVQHPDHVQLFSYKVLNTLCKKAGFREWEILPYNFFAIEMKLKSKSKFKRGMVTMIEKFIHFFEYLFPVLCMGYIVKAKI